MKLEPRPQRLHTLNRAVLAVSDLGMANPGILCGADDFRCNISHPGVLPLAYALVTIPEITSMLDAYGLMKTRTENVNYGLPLNICSSPSGRMSSRKIRRLRLQDSLTYR